MEFNNDCVLTYISSDSTIGIFYIDNTGIYAGNDKADTPVINF